MPKNLVIVRNGTHPAVGRQGIGWFVVLEEVATGSNSALLARWVQSAIEPAAVVLTLACKTPEPSCRHQA